MTISNLKGDSIASRSRVFLSALDFVPHSAVKNYNTVSMISQDLLDILVCPDCKQPVVLHASGTSLKCGVCRRVYPIQDDIPIMLLDVATIDPA
jgi:uncharacterized protein YbaR (Trm112 family)